MIKKNFQKYKTLIYYCLLVFTIASIFSSFSFKILEHYINSTGGNFYSANLATFKNLFYIGLLAALPSIFYIKPKWNLLLFFLLPLFIYASFSVWIGSYSPVESLKFLIVLIGIFVILLLMSSSFINPIKLFFSNIHKRLFNSYQIILISLATIFLIFAFPRYLNFESNFDVEKALVTIENKSDNKVIIELQGAERQIFHRNMARLDNNILAGSIFSIIEIKSDNLTTELVSTIGPDLGWICALSADSLRMEKNNLDSDCFKVLSSSTININVKRNFIQEMDLVGLDTYKVIQSSIDSYIYNRPSLKPDNINLLKVMLNRGHIFHHYQAILEDLNVGISSAFFGQYGFGPLFIIQSIAQTFKLSNFDSIFISIGLINLAVFGFILCFYYKNSFVLVGFLLSLLVVMAQTEIMAPMLYFIRYLPSIVLVVLLCKYDSWLPDKKRNFSIFTLYTLFFIVGIYNKEYAIFTIASLFATTIIYRSITYLKFLAATVFGLVSIYALSLQSFTENTNFLALILGVGYDSSLRINALLWMLFQFVFIVFIHYKIGLKKILPSSFFIYLLIIIFAFKYITHSHINHLGPLILLQFILIDDLLTKYRLGNVAHKVKLLTLTFFISLIVTQYSNLTSIAFKSQYNNVTYIENKESKFFMFDEDLISKFRALKQFSNYDFALISNQDDFLGVLSQKVLTKSMPNLSTNLNTTHDFRKAYALYEHEKYILIDNSILDGRVVEILITSFYNRDSRLNDYIRDYARNVKILDYLAKKLILNRSIVNSNEYFTLYKIDD